MHASSDTGTSNDSKHRRAASTCNCSTSAESCHRLVGEICQTVTALEKTLHADHQQDFKLRLALEQKSEQLQYLEERLAQEKRRSARLITLARGVSTSAEESDDGSVAHYSSTISPLLLQQRYEELSKSYKHCRKSLAKRNAQLTKVKCDIEQLQSTYDHLSSEYSSTQKTFEKLCHKYFRQQERKNYEIDMLKTILSSAIECLIYAQKIIKNNHLTETTDDPQLIVKFEQNLRSFKNSLRYCEWIKSNLTT